MYIIVIRCIRCTIHYIHCGFQVSEFQVFGNLETSGNHWKPGNNLHVLLMKPTLSLRSSFSTSLSLHISAQIGAIGVVWCSISSFSSHHWSYIIVHSPTGMQTSSRRSPRSFTQGHPFIYFFFISDALFFSASPIVDFDLLAFKKALRLLVPQIAPVLNIVR